MSYYCLRVILNIRQKITNTIHPNIHIKNRKASFEYSLLDRFIAGIKLSGTEIKSIRNGKANLNDSFCAFISNELFVRNMHIAEYEMGSYNNHEPKRDRKLLLRKHEIEKLSKKAVVKGFTIIPTRLFISDRGFAKLEIAIAEGKKLHDKRETIRERDDKREMDRAMKHRK